MLLWGVVGLLDVRKRQREFRDWRQRRRAPKSPHEKEPTAGDGVGHELIHQAGDPGICGYLHLQ